MLKPYKDAKKNEQVRMMVREMHARKYVIPTEEGKNAPCITKWMSKQEKIDTIAGHYSINDAMATRVYEIACADGYHDIMARQLYGFDQHNA